MHPDTLVRAEVDLRETSLAESTDQSVLIVEFARAGIDTHEHAREDCEVLGDLYFFNCDFFGFWSTTAHLGL